MKLVVKLVVQSMFHAKIAPKVGEGEEAVGVGAPLQELDHVPRRLEAPLSPLLLLLLLFIITK